jgi:hypothetical protein
LRQQCARLKIRSRSAEFVPRGACTRVRDARDAIAQNRFLLLLETCAEPCFQRFAASSNSWMLRLKIWKIEPRSAGCGEGHCGLPRAAGAPGESPMGASVVICMLSLRILPSLANNSPHSRVARCEAGWKGQYRVVNWSRRRFEQRRRRTETAQGRCPRLFVRQARNTSTCASPPLTQSGS